MSRNIFQVIWKFWKFEIFWSFLSLFCNWKGFLTVSNHRTVHFYVNVKSTKKSLCQVGLIFKARTSFVIFFWFSNIHNFFRSHVRNRIPFLYWIYVQEFMASTVNNKNCRCHTSDWVTFQENMRLFCVNRSLQVHNCLFVIYPNTMCPGLV